MRFRKRRFIVPFNKPNIIIICAALSFISSASCQLMKLKYTGSNKLNQSSCTHEAKLVTSTSTLRPLLKMVVMDNANLNKVI